MGDEPWWVLAIEVAVIGASLAGWLALLAGRRSGGALVPFTPRRPVPWGFFGGTLLVGTILVLTFAQHSAPAPLADAPAQQAAPLSNDDYILAALANSVAPLVFSALAITAVAATTAATPRDLGLPRDASEAAADALLGAKGALLSFAPTLLVQLAMVSLFGTPSQHPLLERIADAPSLGLFGAAFLAAVVAGPIFEELVFRLLLQGWLEKREAELVAAEPSGDAAQNPSPDEPPRPSPADAQPGNPYAAPTEDKPAPLVGPPDDRVVFAGLTRGWWPMLVSALAFALAHFGHGPDPVALFVFGLILGYLYQRTHRLLPCLVCHALFNFTTLTIAWVAAATA